jgi:hypothetical protein
VPVCLCRHRSLDARSGLRGRVVAWGLCLVVSLGVLVGCGGAQQAQSDGQGSAARSASQPDAPGLDLKASGDSVRTIQLYQGSSERALPVLSLGDGGQLTLEFDVLRARSQPLSITFYHADRTWQRDLSPSQYLSSFQNDNLVDYEPSRGTQIPYVHYTYRFPNRDIQFEVSGNYILRVTEQGRPNRVLFERAFFVTESASTLEVGVQAVPVSGQRLPSEAPVARFTPPQALRGSPFQFDACFVRDGAFGAARCAERPRLSSQPSLEFDLERGRAFAPRQTDYFLDLSQLRVGGPVERTDRSQSPFFVMLKPDFAQFASSTAVPRLAGQILVQDVVQSVTEPDVAAEYAEVQFNLVPPREQPVDGEVRIGGSFSGGVAPERQRMRWSAERDRYEGTVLLKQGHYEYFYDTTDPDLQATFQDARTQLRTRYTTFVYYQDPQLNTDRLLAVREVTTQR